MQARLPLAFALVLGACGADTDRGAAPTEQADQAEQAMPATPSRPAAAPAWAVAGSGEGASLRLTAGDGRPVMSLACLANPQRLEVAVPGFSRIGSEDRLSVGVDDEPFALAADLRSPEPGVTATGPVPTGFAARLRAARTVSASYGSQHSGPHAAPAKEAVEVLAAACSRIERADPSALPEAGAPAGSAQEAATVVETYFALLGDGRAAEADALWGAAGADAARSRLGVRPKAEVYAPGEAQGAAGSLYIEVPVRVAAADGATRGGTVTLRRVNDVPGAAVPARRWRIERLELQAR